MLARSWHGLNENSAWTWRGLGPRTWRGLVADLARARRGIGAEMARGCRGSRTGSARKWHR
eukprot:1026488-Lingulodinium_polyedra.AAC.1